MTEPEIEGASQPARSFEELYRQELAAVMALAYVLSGSRTAAEELAQDAFLTAHRSWDRIGAYDDPAAWVRRVCAKRAVSVVRRRMSEARGRRNRRGRASPVPPPPRSIAAAGQHLRQRPAC